MSRMTDESPLPAGDVMVRVDGKLFRCDCGCNVFRHPDPKQADLYKCNSCGQIFRGKR